MDNTNNEIFSRIYSRVANDLANHVHNQLPVVENHVNAAVKAVSDTIPQNLIQNGSAVVTTLLPETSKGYSILGYEFGTYGLIILAVAICCLIYMIYKYFCKCDQEVINVKKNDSKSLDKNKKKLNKDDDSDTDDSDDETS